VEAPSADTLPDMDAWRDEMGEEVAEAAEAAAGQHGWLGAWRQGRGELLTAQAQAQAQGAGDLLELTLTLSRCCSPGCYISFSYSDQWLNKYQSPPAPNYQ